MRARSYIRITLELYFTLDTYRISVIIVIMKINKANSRDKKMFRKKNGMRVVGKSVFVIVAVQVKKGKSNA